MQQPEKVLVPAMVGLDMADAVALAATAEVTVEVVIGPVAVGAVTAQEPQAGTQVEPGSVVQVTVERPDGGGGRDRAPMPVGPDDPAEAGAPTGV